MTSAQDEHDSVQMLMQLLSRRPGLSKSQKWIMGLVNLGMVVVLWVLSSFLVNSLEEDGSYRKPFFITYINTGSFSLYLIPYLREQSLSPQQFLTELKRDYTANGYQTLNFSQSDHDHYNGDQLTQVTSLSEQILRIGISETIMLSLQFVILWFMANYMMNASLSYTSVATQTILSSTASFFTLIIGYFYSVEHINRIKIAGLVLSFAGVVIVTDIDASVTNPNTSPKWVIWGNILALWGAVIYGAYSTFLKRKVTIHHSLWERELNPHLFFGFVGMFCIVLLWPILVILHATGLEPFALPSSRSIAAVLCVNSMITFVSDLCWCKAVLLTSPLTVTVGLSMTIPLAMIGDWVMKGFTLNFLYLCGACIVMIGFFIVNNDEKKDFELYGE